jgi:hypothetical protein
VWKVKRSMAGKIVNLGHPPFAAQVILNGHEYVRISLHRRLPAEIGIVVRREQLQPGARAPVAGHRRAAGAAGGSPPS